MHQIAADLIAKGVKGRIMPEFTTHFDGPGGRFSHLTARYLFPRDLNPTLIDHSDYGDDTDSDDDDAGVSDVG